jgi:hypothetical protein
MLILYLSSHLSAAFILSYFSIAERSLEIARPLLKVAGKLMHGERLPEVLTEVFSSWDLEIARLNTIVRSHGPFEGKMWNVDHLVSYESAQKLAPNQQVVFSAAPGSQWARIGSEFELYSGRFKVAGDLHATAFGGKLQASGESSIVARGSSVVQVTGRANVEAFDSALIQVRQQNTDPYVHRGSITLHDSTNMVDNGASQRGLFRDARIFPTRHEFTAIPTSTAETPFVNTWTLHNSDSPIALAYKRTQQSTFGIDRVYGGKPVLHGTSFLVAERKLATAAHVIRSYDGPIRVMSAEGKFYDAHRFDIDSKHDVALLELDRALPESVNPFHLAQSATIKPGDGVLMVGRSGEQTLAQAHPGKFIDYRRLADLYPDVHERQAIERVGEDPNRLVALTSTNGHPGTSGGPLVLVESHAIAGVVRSGFTNEKLPLNKYTGEKVINGVYTPTRDLTNLLERYGRS